MTARLSSDALDQLTPLLGSLARLIARGLPVSDAQLHTLLIGAGLENEPAALAELERWARLLMALREQPTRENRQTTTEALLLRGLPEATVLLAVATVTEPAPPPQRLTAGVERLDLGTLLPGQGAAAEFEVQSDAPGQIVVESDQVVVTPQQFGAGTTRVRVEALPLTSGVLWTTLRLVTAGETVEVPVVAQWQESLSPAIPQGAFVVAPDGSGTHRTLEEAVAAASPGTTIYLRAGVHHLSRPLQIDKALSLIGEGMEYTRIVCDGKGSVVQYSGEGSFSAGDLAFVHKGSRWADVVRANRGEVHLYRCLFTGGAWDEASPRGGDGLRLYGAVRGDVKECVASGNVMGIRVSQQAQPTLEGNTCQGNKGSGIFYFGRAAGSARNNTCTGNEKNGIYVGEQAQPTLEGNTCQGNKWSGIGYFGRAAGSARHNTCTGNILGIYVGEQAQPTLEGNTCTGNEKSGIYVAPTAQPTLKGNRCRGNKGEEVNDWRRWI